MLDLFIAIVRQKKNMPKICPIDLKEKENSEFCLVFVLSCII